MEAGDVTVLDARGSAGFNEGFGDHIPGAQHAPWKPFTPFIRDKDNDATLLPIPELQAQLRTLGVRNGRPVVVYGDWVNEWGEEGRLFWMLEYLNHTNVKVLYGGVEAWSAEPPYGQGWALEGSVGTTPPGNFIAEVRPDRRATYDEINQAITLDLCNVFLIDTRDKKEFEGTVKLYGAERHGHIGQTGGKEATWYSWKSVFQKDDAGEITGNIKSPEALKAELASYGATDKSIIIAYCTGGIRSGFMYMILRHAGFTAPQNYDGSWWEWAKMEHLAIAAG